MEVIVQFLAGSKFSASTRGHRLISDQPFENGGANTGMTPPELFLASFGTCAGFYAAQYLKARSLSTDGLEITVKGEKAQLPARIGSLRIEISAPSAIGRHEEGLLQAVRACLVHNTLVHSPVIETVVNEAKAVEAEVR